MRAGSSAAPVASLGVTSAAATPAACISGMTRLQFVRLTSHRAPPSCAPVPSEGDINGAFPLRGPLPFIPRCPCGRAGSRRSGFARRPTNAGQNSAQHCTCAEDPRAKTALSEIRAVRLRAGDVPRFRMTKALRMFRIFGRRPRPDATYWSGRRTLAALDAIAWPAAWAIGARCLPSHGGVAGACVVAICAIVAARRVRRALRLNHRYRFTTWRWARLGMALLLFGYALKWAIGA